MLEKIRRLPHEHRAAVLALAAIAVIACFLGDLYVSWDNANYSVWSQGLKAIWTGGLTAGIVSVFTLFFIESRLENSIPGELRPDEINSAFEDILTGSSHWINNAYLGRWMRHVVLPAMAQKGTGAVTTTIIDPREKTVCAAYSEYRAGRLEPADGKGQNDFVRLEALVTLIFCGWYAANTHLNISVYLTKAFNNFRIDGTGDRFVVTQSGRRATAYKFERGTALFDYFSESVKSIYSQSEKIDIPIFRKCSFNDINEKDIVNFFSDTVLEGAAKEITFPVLYSTFKIATNPYPV